MKKLSLLLACLAFAAFSQTAKKPVKPHSQFEIESIEVDGLKRLKPQQVIAASGLKVGATGSKEIFNAAQKRLLESGAFLTVGYRYQPGASGAGFALTFEVAELEQVFPVKFEELGKADSDVKRLLAASDPMFGDVIPGTEQVLNRYAKVLTDALHPAHPIKGRIVSDLPNRVVALFRPSTPRATVAAVDFSGSRAIPEYELQNKLGGVAIGTQFTDAGFRAILDAQIRPLYEAKGMMRVSFPKITAEKSSDVDGVTVHVEVAEGGVYKMGKVTISGAPNGPALLKLLAFKPGGIANFDLIRDGMDTIREELRNSGYMLNTISDERHIDDASKTVDVVLISTPGAQYKFGTLTVEGLDILSEPTVRKMWGLKPGAAFKASYPDYFLKRLKEDGVFENLGETKKLVSVHDSDHTVDVTLVFHAEKPRPKRKFAPPEPEAPELPF